MTRRPRGYVMTAAFSPDGRALAAGDAGAVQTKAAKAALARLGPKQSNLLKEFLMAEKRLRTGKQTRPKTAVKGKRYLCAKCRKRSPKSVKEPAPWYCPKCLEKTEERVHESHESDE